MREECIWLRDWESLEELRAALALWQTAYKAERPHQALDWQSPDERRAEKLARSLRVAA